MPLTDATSPDGDCNTALQRVLTLQAFVIRRWKHVRLVLWELAVSAESNSSMALIIHARYVFKINHSRAFDENTPGSSEMAVRVSGCRWKLTLAGRHLYLHGEKKSCCVVFSPFVVRIMALHSECREA